MAAGGRRRQQRIRDRPRHVHDPARLCLSLRRACSNMRREHDRRKLFNRLALPSALPPSRRDATHARCVLGAMSAAREPDLEPDAPCRRTRAPGRWGCHADGERLQVALHVSVPALCATLHQITSFVTRAHDARLSKAHFTPAVAGALPSWPVQPTPPAAGAGSPPAGSRAGGAGRPARPAPMRPARMRPLWQRSPPCARPPSRLQALEGSPSLFQEKAPPRVLLPATPTHHMQALSSFRRGAWPRGTVSAPAGEWCRLAFSHPARQERADMPPWQAASSARIGQLAVPAVCSSAAPGSASRAAALMMLKSSARSGSHPLMPPVPAHAAAGC